ncbi:hypothetical protein EJ06DRAFT_354139 [Trichodelitschia bisporula]|uniref:Uncharacterized protein n=1 Tax=Trichodelitschia bisporula TaxID=703511 RepID=A0A6G1I075_9PEZI|nr:hypothetical protein EJ06DRAFT_354139 [Trichodelitschia bisporula]
MPSWSNLMGLSLRTKAKACKRLNLHRLHLCKTVTYQQIANAVHGVKLAGLAPVRGASKLVGSAINLCSSGITNTTGIVSSSNAMGESMEAAMSRTSLSDWENLDPNCSTGSENSGTPTPDPIQGELPKASNTTITEPTTDREGASYETAASGGSAEREPSSVPFTYRNMFKPPVDDDGSECK